MRKITNSVIIEKLGQTDKVINIAKLNIESELIKKDSISNLYINLFLQNLQRVENRTCSQGHNILFSELLLPIFQDHFDAQLQTELCFL